ncbi:MAG: aldehyde dehydrogenase family protein [Planctomycetes bacterium]|nr:aldehyde dehydrogenase family protein [Planctomycetota bacterium]
MDTYANFINGEWSPSRSGRFVDNVNPADTRDKIGRVGLSTREEARAAIEAAARAFPAWRETPVPVRGAIIAKAAVILAERKEEISRALTREEGKLLRESRGEVQKAVNVLEFMAGEARRLNGETVPSELPFNFAYTLKQPLGVVSLITPWNFPVCIPAWKIAPALVAGNTCVFKPATLTPATATLLVKVFQDAGVPPGVLNLVIGSGAEVGDEFVTHPAIKAISFTGSNEVGAALYKDGAARLKKVQCEMGGKNPIVVLADADIPLAVEAAAQGAFGSTGQRCTATSRVVIEAGVADRFVELLLERTRRIRVGNPMEAEIDMGPSVDANQYKTVHSYIEIAKAEGAKLVLGGGKLTDGPCAYGFFTAPTIFDHVTRTMRLAKEEVFGPVLAVLRVKDFDEAVEVANDVPYGLTSSVYTNDGAKTFKFIERIETGITHVNSPTMGGEAQLPFGGMKATGVGTREMGRVALDFFTELKTVYIDYTGKKREGNLY